MRPPTTRLPLQLGRLARPTAAAPSPPTRQRSLATRSVLLGAQSTASRDVLGRYAPGAAPIKSRSDVPLTTLLGEAASGDPKRSQVAQAKALPKPSLLQPSLQRPMVMLKDVLTPAVPRAGAGPMTVAGVEVPVKPERPGDEGLCLAGRARCTASPAANQEALPAF